MECMKRNSLLLSFCLLVSSLLAVPVRPVSFVATQTDGSRIILMPHGDEFLHYYMTEDAQPVLCGQDGGYYHVTFNALGQMIPSSMLAHEPQDRTAVERTFLTKRGEVKGMLSAVRQKNSKVRQLAPSSLSPQTRSSYVGEKRGLVILVQFPDCKFSIPNVTSFYQEVLNGNGAPQYNIPASVNRYFSDQSNGMFNLKFDVAGPVTVSKGLTYYGSNNSWGNDKNPEKMVEEAVRLCAPEVDYSAYDWDNDGFADQIFVIYAGYGESQGAPSYTIWPHSSALSSAGASPQFNGVRIDTYACSSELSGNSGVEPDGIGTFCHEFSHCLGLPDFYDVDYSGGYGMLFWSLMDAGCYCGPELKGEVPCNYTGYERWMCGWDEMTELTQGCRVEGMASITDFGPTYVIRNQTYSNEYYLLENRQQTGWDAYLPAHGLLVMHVDYDERAWLQNTVNDVKSHQRFVVVPADNRETQTFADSKGDVYPGLTGKTSFTDTTVPAATLFHANADGRKFLGRPIEQITEASDGKVSFVFNGGESDAIHGVPASAKVSTGMYTLQGQPVEKTVGSGIYIKDGRKVLVK